MAKNPGISNGAAKAACDAIVDLLDGGAGAGKIRIYNGTQPSSGPDEAVTTQTLLAELALSDPAFGNAADAAPGGRATANAISDDTSADANGTASWFRALDSDNNPIIDGSVGTSDADLVLDDVNLVAGQTVKVNSWTFQINEQ